MSPYERKQQEQKERDQHRNEDQRRHQQGGQAHFQQRTEARNPQARSEDRNAPARPEEASHRQGYRDSLQDNNRATQSRFEQPQKEDAHNPQNPRKRGRPDDLEANQSQAKRRKQETPKRKW